jgi:ParB family transcriptional regulator, chromosome partitioning protein
MDFAHRAKGLTMSRKNIFAALPPQPLVVNPGSDRVDPTTSESPTVEAPLQHVKAVRGIGHMLDGFREKSDRADHIQRELENGQNIVSLDPALIDPSPIRDRIDDPNSAEEQELRESIAEHGQRIAVLVRPHPTMPMRYITVFGHRRIAAIRALGGSVRAVVMALDDEEALVIQGQENNLRKNTSFIERSLYAKRLKDAGMNLTKIAAALGLHRTLIVKQIAVAESIPEDLILAIGPAPDVGRPRWMALVAAIASVPKKWRAKVGAPEFSAAPTNERFRIVLESLTVKRDSGAAVPSSSLSDRNGAAYATVRRSAKLVTYAIQNEVKNRRADGLTFAEWMDKRLPELREDFLNGA